MIVDFAIHDKGDGNPHAHATARPLRFRQVALGVPAVYFWTFFHSLSLQIKKDGPAPRPFYRLLLDDEGLSVWMAGEQDKP